MDESAGRLADTSRTEKRLWHSCSFLLMFRERGKKYFQPYWLVALSLGATLLWIVSLDGVDLRAMNDLGLISVLPPMVFVALGLMSISFCLAIHQKQLSGQVLLVHLLILIFMLYGIAPIIEDTLRTGIAWKLVGIVDFVMQTGTVDPNIDAFHNWPGFYILVAFVTEILGLKSPLTFAAWAPIFLNLLYLAPLVMIFRAGTDDKRLVWLAVWLFYLTNWIGQDYLSPQGFSYFLYLVILGILLRWFRETPAQPELFFEGWLKIPLIATLVVKARRYFSPNSLPDQISQPWQRVGLLAIMIILFGVIVPSHQLTPFATIAAVTTLVIFKRLTPRGLPVLMVIMTGTWISFMAVSYLSGHVEQILSPLGSVAENVSANITGRIRGSQEHNFIVKFRLGMTMFLYTLAFLGGVRRQKAGRLDLNFALLAAVPFSLLAFQTYGGELLLRSYLFALPFMVFFAAALFFPESKPVASRPTTVAIGLVSLVLSIGFFFTRYGNERMYYFTADEVKAVQYLYRIAEPGSQLIAGSGSLPWRFQDYKSYRYVTVEDVVKTGDLKPLIDVMQKREYPGSYLILSRGQKAAIELYIGWPSGTWERFEQALLESKEFKLIFNNEDAKIFILTSDLHGAKPGAGAATSYGQ